jgi:hypothetical protein
MKQLLQTLATAALAFVLIFAAPALAKISYGGGAGSSFGTAITIKASNNFEGVKAEYAWIRKRLPGWRVVGQSLLTRGSKNYDVIEITKAGKRKTLYFDITNFFGKY